MVSLISFIAPCWGVIHSSQFKKLDCSFSCLTLTASQREQPHDRALSRLQGLNIKLGGIGCTLDGMPPKPKGMHQRTYQRIAARYERLEKVMDLATVARFGFSFWLRKQSWSASFDTSTRMRASVALQVYSLMRKGLLDSSHVTANWGGRNQSAPHAKWICDPHRTREGLNSKEFAYANSA
jgi:hypothetical protein